MRIQNISFKGYMPVDVYAFNPKNGQYTPVIEEKDLKKCRTIIVKNLNHTAGKKENPKLSNGYKQIDKDYAKKEFVTSMESSKPYTFLIISGQDALNIRELGKKMGKEKQAIYQETGNMQAGGIKDAKKTYHKSIKNYMLNKCKRVKTQDGHNIRMKAIFTQTFNKKGEHTGFEYKDSSYEIMLNA